MLATPSDHSSHNLLLAALPPAEMHVFREQGQKVFLHEGKTVQAAGVDTEWVFFPTTALLSLMGVTQDGLSVETGLVGKEGMVGLQQYFGPHTQPLDCVVQQEGEVCQAPVALLRQANLPTLQRCLLGYANYRLTELAQAAVCNKFHLVRQRFTRWLLTARDRSGKDHMEFTQELLSAMVGARRPVVTSLIGRLQKERLIEYRRGGISLLNRAGLERSACECYMVVSSALADYRSSIQAHR